MGELPRRNSAECWPEHNRYCVGDIVLLGPGPEVLISGLETPNEPLPVWRFQVWSEGLRSKAIEIKRWIGHATKGWIRHGSEHVQHHVKRCCTHSEIAEKCFLPEMNKKSFLYLLSILRTKKVSHLISKDWYSPGSSWRMDVHSLIITFRKKAPYT